MYLRPYQISDTPILALIFKDAVINTGSQAYSAEQVSIWSSSPDDEEEFQQRLMKGLTIVAVEDITSQNITLQNITSQKSQPVAFGQLEPENHIALLYTASEYNRMGCGTKIYQQLESHAIANNVPTLYTEASRISKHFFLKVGFKVVEVEMAEYKGMIFERFKMEKVITQA